MLDIQFIRDNPDLVKEKSQQKQLKVDINALLELDNQRRTQLTKIEALRQRRNEHAQKSGKAKPSEAQIAEGRQIKDELSKLEKALDLIDKKFWPLLKQVPNMPLDDVPVGASEADNQVVKQVGVKKEFVFKPKNHAEIVKTKDLVDKERAAKVAGSRFAYIKGDLVRLQFALMQFALETLGNEKIIEELIQKNKLELSAKPFIPVLPPALIRTDAYEASTRLNAEEQTYKLADDELWLNASAEHSLSTMYLDEIVDEKDLPIRYVGFSTSFRREAGSYGKDIEGIIRMHQFDKLEMESFTTPETGLQEHLLLIAIQEYLMQQLDLPYQVLNKCTADIGKPNARGVDINVWLPGENKYLETHTADYMTDYQARSTRSRLRRTGGSVELLHTNDATAFSQRPLIAILENYQTKDGRVIIPKVLQPYMGGKTEL